MVTQNPVVHQGHFQLRKVRCVPVNNKCIKNNLRTVDVGEVPTRIDTSPHFGDPDVMQLEMALMKHCILSYHYAVGGSACGKFPTGSFIVCITVCGGYSFQ
jgi:hypothetical protein